MLKYLGKTTIALAALGLSLIACAPSSPGGSAGTASGQDKPATPTSPGAGGDTSVKVIQGGKSVGLPAGFGLKAQYHDTSSGKKFDMGSADGAAKLNQIYLRAANKSDQILVEMGIDLPGKTVADYRGKAVSEKSSKCTLIFSARNYGGSTEGMKDVGTIFPGACDIDISSAGAPLKGKVTMGDTTVELNIP